MIFFLFIMIYKFNIIIYLLKYLHVFLKYFEYKLIHKYVNINIFRIHI